MKFEKVSFNQYVKDSAGDTLTDADSSMSIELASVRAGMIDLSGYECITDDEVYERIKLPKRATKKSAGYDFYAPYDFTIRPNQTLKIATGIRVLLDDDKFLMCAPRSGHGFKARLQLDNTLGIIDADYSDSSNEGHIMLKLTNDSKLGKSISVKRGEGMLQAIIVPYFTVEDDNTSAQRDGGFGSTDTKKEDN